jgi:hypothetical protein
LERFISLLNTQERGTVAAGKYDQAAAFFKTRLATDAELEKRYRDVLHDENIAFFDVEDVMRFFNGSMRARAKLFRFINILEKTEVLAFNEKRFSELARSLNARLLADAELFDEYQDKIAPGLQREDEALLSQQHLIATIVRPFAQLYAVMNQGERELLVKNESPKACRSLATRLATEPAVQRALAALRALIPSTRDLDLPSMVFDAAAAAQITNAEARLALVAMADWLIARAAANQSADLDALPTALPVELQIVAGTLPALDEGTKRELLLQRDISWFAEVVDEKIDFFAEGAAQ